MGNYLHNFYLYITSLEAEVWNTLTHIHSMMSTQVDSDGPFPLVGWRVLNQRLPWFPLSHLPGETQFTLRLCASTHTHRSVTCWETLVLFSHTQPSQISGFQVTVLTFEFRRFCPQLNEDVQMLFCCVLFKQSIWYKMNALAFCPRLEDS